jgi:hypothetical protein
MIALYASLASGQQPVEPEPAPEVPAEELPAEELPAEESPGEVVAVEVPEPEPVADEQLPSVPEASASLPAQEAELYEPPVYPRRFGLDIRYGWLNNTDPAYDLFASHDGMISFGFAGSYRLARNLVVVGSWHHVRQGAEVYVGGTDTTLDFQPQNQSFRAALLAHEVALGARVDVPIEDLFFPYVSVVGELMPSRARLDDVPDRRDNPTQVQASALHMGGLVTGGAELRLVPEARVQLALSLELGYAWLTRDEIGELGEMKPGGFVSRLGAGIRF